MKNHIIRKKSRVSTISTTMWTSSYAHVNKLSTSYPQFVDNVLPVDKVIQSENTNIISDISLGAMAFKLYPQL